MLWYCATSTPGSATQLSQPAQPASSALYFLRVSTSPLHREPVLTLALLSIESAIVWPGGAALAFGADWVDCAVSAIVIVRIAGEAKSGTQWVTAARLCA